MTIGLNSVYITKPSKTHILQGKERYGEGTLDLDGMHIYCCTVMIHKLDTTLSLCIAELSQYLTSRVFKWSKQAQLSEWWSENQTKNDQTI